jgi:hypothetical protein
MRRDQHRWLTALTALTASTRSTSSGVATHLLSHPGADGKSTVATVTTGGTPAEAVGFAVQRRCACSPPGPSPPPPGTAWPCGSSASGGAHRRPRRRRASTTISRRMTFEPVGITGHDRAISQQQEQSQDHQEDTADGAGEEQARDQERGKSDDDQGAGHTIERLQWSAAEVFELLAAAGVFLGAVGAHWSMVTAARGRGDRRVRFWWGQSVSFRRRKVARSTSRRHFPVVGTEPR